MTSSYTLLSNLEHKIENHALVGMAVYEGDRLDWIKQAIKSVLTQSYQDFTLIIVIDGEVHNDVYTLLVNLEHQHNNLILLKTTENQGLSVCMNLIVDLFVKKNTQYFFRMDADDISMKDRFLKQVQFFEQNPNIDILGTALIEINEKGKKVGSRKLPIKHHEILRILPKRCAINHPTVALRAGIFKDGFRYRGDLKNTQDYFLWAELCANNYIFANLPKALLKFRRVNDFYKRRGLSKSINEFKARFYTMKVLKRYSMGNIVYACAVLFLRLMPAKLVKLAYKIDRYLLNKRVRHE
ncbi:glycosyltransferase [Aliiglaciecola litoralis]|uniref:glycosyltransferase n=1 Tax=Aliiglaciecola litoralis TaxID=582857 RepID=UPI0031DED17E